MNIHYVVNRLLLIFSGIIFLTHLCHAAGGPFTTETGGVEIILSNGWESLDQPINFFVQKRARNAEQGIALSAGSFTLDLTLEQYTALGLTGVASGPDAAIEKLAKDVGIPKEDVEKALASQIGRQFTDSLKQASQTMKFELLKVAKSEINGGTRFEIQSKVIVKESGQTIFSRQFVLAGSSPREIVQITFASASKEIFSSKNLADAIHPKAKTK